MIYTARSAKYRQYLNRVEDRSFAPHTFIAYVRGDDSFWVGGGKAEQRDIGTIRLRTDNKVMTVAFAQLMQMKMRKSVVHAGHSVEIVNDNSTQCNSKALCSST